MRTVTAEEFEKMYGKQAASSFTGGTSQAKGESLIDKLKGRGQDIYDAVSKSVSDSGDLGDLVNAGIRVPGAIAGGINDTIGAAMMKVDDAVGSPIQNVVGEAAKTPLVQGAIEAYAGWKAQHPDAAKNLESVVNIASLFPVNESVRMLFNGAEKAVTAGIDSGKSVLQKAMSFTKDGGKGFTEKMSNTKVFTKARDLATPIDDATENVLKTTNVDKFNKYAEQAQKAMQNVKEATPMELAGEEAKSALKQINGIRQEVGAQKAAVTKNIGNSISAESVVSGGMKSLYDGVRRFGIGIRRAADGSFKFVRMVGREFAVPKSDLKIVNEFLNKLGSLKDHGFQRVDDTIDYLQKFLYKKNAAKLTVPMDKEVNQMLKEVLGGMNKSMKELATKSGFADYAKFNNLYARLTNLITKLNKGLGAEGSRGAQLMKQLFSPAGTVPRRLFKDVYDLTGKDLAEEATLAKYAMERAGDIRQKSMLENAITGQTNPFTKSGIKQIVAHQVEQKLQDPFGKARRIIEKSKEAKVK